MVGRAAGSGRNDTCPRQDEGGEGAPRAEIERGGLGSGWRLRAVVLAPRRLQSAGSGTATAVVEEHPHARLALESGPCRSQTRLVGVLQRREWTNGGTGQRFVERRASELSNGCCFGTWSATKMSRNSSQRTIVPGPRESMCVPFT